MNNDILDEDLVVESARSFRLVNFISIVILWMGIGVCAIFGLIGETKVLISAAILMLSTGITIYKVDWGAFVTLIVILAGMFNVLYFFPIKYSISFGIGAIGAGVEVILFGVAIIHSVLNWNELAMTIKDLLRVEKTEEVEEFSQRSVIVGFKRRFASKQKYELEKMINNDKLVPEARMAAKELVDEIDVNSES